MINMSAVVGTIPTKISYVYSESKDIYPGCGKDIDEVMVAETVYPSYPADHDIDKAKKWVADVHRIYDYKTNKYINSTVPIQIDTLDNTPITNIKVLRLESSYSGGSKFKVVIDNKYYVDICEDVIIDVMLQSGISVGGSLGGSYMWVKLGNQLRLVRIGSKLYNKLEESNRKSLLPKIRKRDLEVGGIYQSRRGDRGVFVGYVNTFEYLGANEFSFVQRPVKKAMLFYNYMSESKLNHKSQDDLIELDLAKCENREMGWKFSICKSHHYIEKIGTTTIKKDYVVLLKRHSIDAIKQDVLEFTGHKAPQSHYSKITKRILESNICYYSTKMNVSKYGEPNVEPFDVRTLIIFS